MESFYGRRRWRCCWLTVWTVWLYDLHACMTYSRLCLHDLHVCMTYSMITRLTCMHAWLTAGLVHRSRGIAADSTHYWRTSDQQGGLSRSKEEGHLQSKQNVYNELSVWKLCIFVLGEVLICSFPSTRLDSRCTSCMISGQSGRDRSGSRIPFFRI